MAANCFGAVLQVTKPDRPLWVVSRLLQRTIAGSAYWIRAEREAGKMMKGMERRRPGGNGSNQHHKSNTDQREPNSSEFAEAKESANISDSQAKRWQKLTYILSSNINRRHMTKGQRAMATCLVSKQT